MVRILLFITMKYHIIHLCALMPSGFKVVVVKSDEQGNVDVKDLRAQCDKYSKDIAALMVTYPSTYGVFEEQIRHIVDLVHSHGGQVE